MRSLPTPLCHEEDGASRPTPAAGRKGASAAEVLALFVLKELLHNLTPLHVFGNLQEHIQPYKPTAIATAHLLPIKTPLDSRHRCCWSFGRKRENAFFELPGIYGQSSPKKVLPCNPCIGAARELWELSRVERSAGTAWWFARCRDRWFRRQEPPPSAPWRRQGACPRWCLWTRNTWGESPYGAGALQAGSVGRGRGRSAYCVSLREGGVASSGTGGGERERQRLDGAVRGGASCVCACSKRFRRSHEGSQSEQRKRRCALCSPPRQAAARLAAAVQLQRNSCARLCTLQYELFVASWVHFYCHWPAVVSGIGPAYVAGQTLVAWPLRKSWPQQ